MKKGITIICVFLLLINLSLVGCSEIDKVVNGVKEGWKATTKKDSTSKLTCGNWDGRTYSNEMFEFKITIPEKMNLMKTTTTDMDNKELSKGFKINNASKTLKVQVGFENIAKKLGSNEEVAKYHINQLKTMLEKIYPGTYTYGKQDKKIVAGQEYISLSLIATSNDINYDMLLLMRKQGDKISYIIILVAQDENTKEDSTFSETVDTVIQLFEPLSQ